VTQRWLIRVASHARHGGGHVARCGNLGSALARAGADVMMQLDPDSPDASARLHRFGFACSESEIPPNGVWDGSVVDGYELMGEVAAGLARRAPPLVVIDDFLSPPKGAALVVNSALHLAGERVGDTPALLGPRFAMIDPRYAQMSPKTTSGPVRNVLVTTGRVDPLGLASQAVHALTSFEHDATITVVTSPDLPGHTALVKQVDALGPRGRLVLDAPDMVDALDDADFVIGAGGVSLMERMAAGVPSMTLLLAENQCLFIEGAARLGATIDGGQLVPEELAGALQAVFADKGARVAMAAAGRAAIDGEGADRVAERLMVLCDETITSRKSVS
jgi:UDP-2,4-diacetamido-2,4,6-trideoxy-beta-L-altropyranose hydrolase